VSSVGLKNPFQRGLFTNGRKPRQEEINKLSLFIKVVRIKVGDFEA